MSNSQKRRHNAEGKDPLSVQGLRTLACHNGEPIVIRHALDTSDLCNSFADSLIAIAGP